eukprot:310027-Heterocapsa_arctica.AAC.1
MTKKEEEDILQWFEENPECKEDASRYYDKELQVEGRSIKRKNVTLGNHIFDNPIGGHQAMKVGRDQMNLQICGKHRSVPWFTLKRFFANEENWDDDLSDKDIWDIIVGTRHNDEKFNSFMIKIWPSKNMTVIKATPIGGLKRKNEAEAHEGLKKPAPGGQMKGDGSQGPPWRMYGMACTGPVGQYNAGAASSGQQSGTPNAAGWIYPPNMQQQGGAPVQPWMSQQWEQQPGQQPWDQRIEGLANQGWQQHGPSIKGKGKSLLTADKILSSARTETRALATIFTFPVSSGSTVGKDGTHSVVINTDKVTRKASTTISL